ncbi:MAG: sigma-54-dependent Fis family transcriptional regulator [Bacteroidetes Order II. Incertae sedis bacterium]|mgnify:FL=1|jgi:DNA-binding NtrC family response regulator|nr:sigma-54-dependent Fis family transcriptional regulator [Bacteroidetes Order II. bacterium]MBT5249987.1 sigma-54-dependent Fis family transcriptional regulator [Bacteroidetes Order II. bacterium]MBT6200599.1 sigma-54-dependent Fis family transcriptional regulator [Bacteroidetes Order II. bacterium]MBT6425082.1 sigma-54-dependent Fis family transcriptional regulator [Bacteroidetes Order II. bacterium]MBT6580761.1 sigma-54-dependent Fis family transcriptional regulator [Bacteroidetes Order II.
MDRQSMQERFGIIGASSGVRNALDRVRLVASTEITVLIQGESGTGKELFAQALHETSGRRHRKMQVMNCGAIPEGLIESELFGAEKGAYTGAVERRQGYFEEADGSTIFLDEIGEMPLTAQVRLLRVLETGEFSRVGSTAILKSDVRVVAATNKDLAREVEAGRFREDLYYRLSTVILHVPPLRDRREDILPIFEHFQHRFSQQYNTSGRRLDLNAREMLMRYRWPGNIRELRNVAEQTVVLLKGDTIGSEDIRPYLRGVTANGSGVGLVPIASTGGNAPDDGTGARERELIYRALLEMRGEVRDLKEQIAILVSAARTGAQPEVPSMLEASRLLVMHDEPQSADTSFIEEAPYEFDTDDDAPAPSGSNDLPTLEDSERTLILTALSRYDGNRRQTAESLGISERTLYRKLKEIEAAGHLPE